MRKMLWQKWKKRLAICLAMLVTLSFVSCATGGGSAGDGSITNGGATNGGGTTDGELTENPLNNAPIVERAQVNDGKVKEFLKDLNFSHGISVTPFISNTSKKEPWGILTYDDKCIGVGDSEKWSMAQWGCTHDMREDYTFTRDGYMMTYEDGGKYLQVNTDPNSTGEMTLGIKGSEEYSRDEDGNIRERTNLTENWPHILMSQGINQAIDPDAEALYMEITYEVTQCESLVDRSIYPLNTDINAAQFQWFITLYDNNPDSVTYNHAMWFGFSMFDSRHEGSTPTGYAAYDGGKEDSTSAFIYMFSLNQVTGYEDSYVNSTPTAVVGKEVSVKVNIMPFIKAALKVAKQNGSHTGASSDMLKIGSTNIGWELPGNYDAEVKISKLNMYQTY
ncbi:MAG: hypothetical protein IJ329_02440 [Clostridia bacterium]|nr:hypothetical protein [Clostridia bacterium]